MKTGTTDHPKTKALARLLGVGRYAAIGLLEALWHATAKYSPRGDIGRFSDAEIADLCFWDGPASKLIEALIVSKWLDERAKGRLWVHDWHEHAEDAVHMRLGRAGERFSNGSIPRLGRLTTEEKAIARAKYDVDKSARRAHSKRTTNAPPSHPIPSHPIPSHGGVGDPPTPTPPISGSSHPDESNPPPLCGAERIIRRWVGNRLSASDRDKLAKAERQRGESDPVVIHDVMQPAITLFERAIVEAIASSSDGGFRSMGPFLRLVGSIEARCARDGCWPGEGLERQNGHAEKTIDELLAADKARRAAL